MKQGNSKFDVACDMSGYSLTVGTEQTYIDVGATEEDLRRLMIQLMSMFPPAEGYDTDEVEQ